MVFQNEFYAVILICPHNIPELTRLNAFSGPNAPPGLNGTKRCNFGFIYFGKSDFSSKPFFFFFCGPRLALCVLACFFCICSLPVMSKSECSEVEPLPDIEGMV